MKQCPDVIKNLKKGDKFHAYDIETGTALGGYVFNEWVWIDGFQHAYCTSISDANRPGGRVYKADLRQFILTKHTCQHEWKRLDLFRTTEFHCKHCPATRAFDKEKDEAA